MSKDIPTSVRLDRSLKKELERWARLDGRTLTYLIRHILAEWCKRRGSKEAGK
jgi:predicted transcriptional regulator